MKFIEILTFAKINPCQCGTVSKTEHLYDYSFFQKSAFATVEQSSELSNFSEICRLALSIHILIAKAFWRLSYFNNKKKKEKKAASMTKSIYAKCEQQISLCILTV